jgi:multisubunit Na+/H+ antiporter MnhB subunit
MIPDAPPPVKKRRTTHWKAVALAYRNEAEQAAKNWRRRLIMVGIVGVAVGFLAGWLVGR